MKYLRSTRPSLKPDETTAALKMIPKAWGLKGLDALPFFAPRLHCEFRSLLLGTEDVPGGRALGRLAELLT